MVDRALLTTDAESLVERADVVVEVMGGIEPGAEPAAAGDRRRYVRRDRQQGPPRAGRPTLYAAADEAGRRRYFEAAVAGAIPIVRPVRESLAGDRVTRVLGIVNGTTNYVLDKMASEGLDLDQAVKEAQALGYAEADPTADVEGYDAAAKAAILASLAFHTRVSIDDVSREGITSLTADDVLWAQRTGYVLKLLAIAERGTANGVEGVQVRVHPALVPLSHPLATVRGAYNAVFIEAEAAGELMFYGRGAGGEPPRPPCSVTSSRSPGTACSAARARSSPATPSCPCCPRPPRGPATRCGSRSRTAPGCWPRSRRSWRRTTSRSRPCVDARSCPRRPTPTTRAW